MTAELPGVNASDPPATDPPATDPLATDPPATDPSVAADRTLRARALLTLRAAILEGRLPAGQRLVERELCALAGVSRSILREALVSLETTGLIERESYRGYRVCRIGPRKICEIFELRASLETQAAELFAERASEAEIAALRAAFAAIMEAQGDFASGRMLAAKDRYFEVILAGCRNVEIRRALSLAIDRIELLRSRLIADPERRRRSIPEMERLTNALAARDRLEARAATAAHLINARDALLAMLRRDEAQAPPA